MRGAVLILGFLVLVFLLVIFQISLLNQIFFFSSSPNLILVLPFSVFPPLGSRASAWTAFLGGFIYDILTLRAVGSTSLTLLFLLVTYALIRRFFSSSSLTHLFSFFLLSFVSRFFLLSPRFNFSHLALSAVEVLALMTLSLLFRVLRNVLGSSNYIQLKFEKLE